MRLICLFDVYGQEWLGNLEQSLLEILDKVVSRLKIIKLKFGPDI